MDVDGCTSEFFSNAAQFAERKKQFDTLEILEKDVDSTTKMGLLTKISFSWVDLGK